MVGCARHYASRNAVAPIRIVTSMDTAIYLGTDDGLYVVRSSSGSDGEWHGQMRLKSQVVRCITAGARGSKTLYCGAFDEGVYRSNDGGASWGFCDGAPRRVLSLAVAGSEDSSVVYAGTEPSAVFRSDDGGASWHELPSLLTLASAKTWSFPPRPETHHVRYILLDPNVPRRLYVAIEAGALLRSDDGGQTWRDRVPGGPRDTHTLAAHPNAPGRLYSAAGDGYFESTDSGDTWRRISDGLNHQYCWSVAVSIGDPDTILLTSSKSARDAHSKSFENSFYRRSAGGWWHEVRDGLPASEERRVGLVAASAVEPDLFYAAWESDIYRSIDGGVRWQRLMVNWAGDPHPGHVVSLAVVESD